MFDFLRRWTAPRTAPPAGLGNAPAPAATARRRGTVPDDLWHSTLADYPFLADRPAADVSSLRERVALFLDQKEFFGAHGLQVTDRMAVAIAAQACLPVLHLGRSPAQALAWYGDFVGIVVHADAVVARRESVDDAGVVHQYDEVLAGEAMQGGPVTLAWRDVADAAALAADGYNLVIHEFVHKIDMRNGPADGCPPLPPGFAGTRTAREARALWQRTLEAAHRDFREKTIIAERFGGPAPWLDAYAAESPTEFFAVACEAYFVQRTAFARDFAPLVPLFDAFFRPDRPSSAHSETLIN